MNNDVIWNSPETLPGRSEKYRDIYLPVGVVLKTMSCDRVEEVLIGDSSAGRYANFHADEMWSEPWRISTEIKRLIGWRWVADEYKERYLKENYL